MLKAKFGVGFVNCFDGVECRKTKEHSKNGIKD